MADKINIKKIINQIKNKDKFERIFRNKEDLENFILFYYNLSFDNMKRLSSLCYQIRKIKYSHKKGRLLGNQTKAMPDDVFNKLLGFVNQKWGEKVKLALEFEGIEGPRGEDVVRLRLDDIDFDKHIVRIYNRKVNRMYEIPLNKDLENELKHFITENRKEIEAHNGYIFYSQNPFQKRNFLSQKWLRNIVRKALDKLGLNKVYAVDAKGRKLHLYSLHSLRGHAATRIYKKTHDLEKVQELLDHTPSSTKTTMLYIERNDDEDLKEVI